MTIQELGSLGEFVAAVATIATLIYLALQIRHNTDSVRISAEMNVSHQMGDWIAQGINDPEIGRLWDKAADDSGSLSDDEMRRWIWYVSHLFLIYEGQYNLYRRGHIPEDTWLSKLNVLVGLMRNPAVKSWWDSRAAPYTPEFYAYIDEKCSTDTNEWSQTNIVKSAKPAT